MARPKKRIIAALNYQEIIDYIEEKYKIKTRDYLGHFGANDNFQRYQSLTGDKMPCDYPAPGSASYKADFKLIHEHFARYREWEKSNPGVEYCDYWHWLIENQFCEISNGRSENWNLTEILNNNSAPTWVKAITQLVYDEFKDDLDSSGSLDVWIEW